MTMTMTTVEVLRLAGLALLFNDQNIRERALEAINVELARIEAASAPRAFPPAPIIPIPAPA